MKRDGHMESLWQATTGSRTTPSYNREPQPALTYDVVIVGAGMTGVTTALLLQKKGFNVLLAEAQNACFGTTGGTTAHLNTLMDTPYPTMIKNFGEAHATGVATAVRDALLHIRANISEYNIDCGYNIEDAFLYAQDDQQEKELEDILLATKKVGIEVEQSSDSPVPVPFTKGLRFPGNARFHPTRYVMPLLEEFIKLGGEYRDNCRVTQVEEAARLTIHTTQGEFFAHRLIYATHIPPGVNLLHFRCAPYRSYAIAVELEDEAQYPGGLAYDMYDPYHYFRTQEVDGQKYLIAGGEDHKTGHHENTETCFMLLEAYVRTHFAVKQVAYKWSSQYFEPTDGLPYIGLLPGANSDNIYVATGYGGNGMVYSHVAALTFAEMFIDKQSNLEKLFDPNRVKPVAGFASFVKESADVAGLLFSKLKPPPTLDTLADLAPGEARIVKYEGTKLAVYKHESGELFMTSAACTHIQCDVAWNSAEKSWDCPCHGSRFSYTGEMLTGPARKDLSDYDMQSAKITSKS
ncbi:FAD-dependent oxidoreductase [Chitinophaga horti]|uniref:FAD-dependent oxidoreductase n=1 Tax=Chitinophaga horti TaxID=2920382 RepID=A0ABY6J3Z4_9BACT|nr:FAD-dependent oxidoreductase [Chitinophaga horti]UYQ94096.1 FAD-dependent oxidoreductase [Chitinophaga horti]